MIYKNIVLKESIGKIYYLIVTKTALTNIIKIFYLVVNILVSEMRSYALIQHALVFLFIVYLITPSRFLIYFPILTISVFLTFKLFKYFYNKFALI